MPAEERVWLTVRQAARRVGRSERTIWKWKRDGMPTRTVGGVVYVGLGTVQAELRAHLARDRTHQKRMATRRAGDLRNGNVQTP